MKREVNNAIRSAESIGDNMYTIAMVVPDVLENSIKLGRDIVVIPLAVVKGATSTTAEKIDDAVDFVV